MRKSIRNNILAIASIIAVFGIAALYGFRRQGGRRPLNLTAAPETVTELRLQAGAVKLRLFRQGETWYLTHPAYAQPVPADARTIETLLDDMRHWELQGLTPADSLRPDTADDTRMSTAEGRLRVYARGRWRARKVWDRLWWRTDSALYLREGRRLYGRLYDPRRADATGSRSLTTGFTADARHWHHKWISHYYYYEIARAEWRSADAHYVYKPAAPEESTAPAVSAALSAFRSVHFDRYAEATDAETLAIALNHPPVARFSVVSTSGDSTHLTAYTLYDTAGQADWFRLCGILRSSTPATPTVSGSPAPPDTVFLSYQLLDRLRAALAATESATAIPRP